MKSLLAFMKKEWTEQLRSGRVTILGILFVLFGIMNPAIAKLTPWLLETMADSLEASGMIVTSVTVSAMDSWVQFFKNIPMALIVFVLMESSVFTREYQTGTLLLVLTKGLERYKIVVSKTVVLSLIWSLGYWVCFGVTYGYNAYFWDNTVAQNLLFSVTCWWLFGLWVISLMVLFSTMVSVNSGVMLGTGAVVLGSYLLSLLPKIKPYAPTMLMDGNTLIFGVCEAQSYRNALVITLVLWVLCLATAIPLFNKKQL